MEKFGVQISLEAVREARTAWNKARREFDQSVDQIMTRLLHEAARNMMSVHDVAVASGLTVSQVRAKLRGMGLNPRDGKRLLADKAAKALHENSALLGVQPHEFDLMSPLAYLPMGQELKRELLAQQASKVTEADEVSGNVVFVLTSWDNPEGGLYEGVFKTREDAEQHAALVLQDGQGETLWIEDGPSSWYGKNLDATYGSRELRIAAVEA